VAELLQSSEQYKRLYDLQFQTGAAREAAETSDDDP